MKLLRCEKLCHVGETCASKLIVGVMVRHRKRKEVKEHEEH